MNSTKPHPSVRHRFSAAADSYDRHAQAQREAAGILFEILPPPHDINTILETGCGTGYLTRRLASLYPDATIEALDLSPDMVAAAKAAVPQRSSIHWHVGDFTAFTSDKRFDLLASNAAMHWFEPQDAAFAAARNLLQPHGTLCASVMLHDTLQELHDTRLRCAPHKPPASRLPTPDQLRNTLDSTGFSVAHFDRRSIEVVYPSARDLLTALREMGLTGGRVSRSHQALQRGELEQVVTEYEDRYASPGGGVIATYDVAILRAEKSE